MRNILFQLQHVQHKLKTVEFLLFNSKFTSFSIKQICNFNFNKPEIELLFLNSFILASLPKELVELCLNPSLGVISDGFTLHKHRTIS